MRWAAQSPAGHYQANAFDLYDMAGNAWQWTADCFQRSYDDTPIDGSAVTAAAYPIDHVARGGSWYNIPRFLRAAIRVPWRADPNYDIGSAWPGRLAVEARLNTGRGKRGGARVIYFHHDAGMPLFALTAYAKNERADLSQQDRNDFRQLTSLLVEAFKRRNS